MSPRLGRRLSRGAVPYLLGLPSWLYLLAFFLVPLVAMLSMSLATGNPLVGYVFNWHFAEFGMASGALPDATRPLVLVRRAVDLRSPW